MRWLIGGRRGRISRIITPEWFGEILRRRSWARCRDPFLTLTLGGMDIDNLRGLLAHRTRAVRENYTGILERGLSNFCPSRRLKWIIERSRVGDFVDRRLIFAFTFGTG